MAQAAFSHLTEIRNLNSLLRQLPKTVRAETRLLNEVTVKNPRSENETLPIHGLIVGNEDKSAPTFGLFGGAHGLERVGTHVVLNYLGPFFAQLAWDETLQAAFQKARLVAMPIINPGGLYLNRRSNPNGVDIMRNAPVEAVGKTQPLVSGHRYTPLLPWYRGRESQPMEVETQTLISFLREEVLPSKFSMTLDVHSGFGMRDRLWYPYSRSSEIFPYHQQVTSFEKVLSSAQPFHVYKIEPQHESYKIHGDPWDFIYDEHREKHAGSIFMPWCLEMGSWTWLKKNPRQLFLRGGIFNPILPHRYGRIMRRHRPLLDLMKQATIHYQNWI